MVTASLDRRSNLSEVIGALVRQDGTACSGHAAALARPTAHLRDMADAIHALAVVHGTFPGIVDHVRTSCSDDGVLPWLEPAVEAVARERELLAQLTAVAGPRPSTPGHHAAESAIAAQCHALVMLATSDRQGCAAGTAIAFVLDWAAVRPLLENCAHRCGTAVSFGVEPLIDATTAMLARLAPAPAVERAMVFGAQQMLAQHRGLWNLLEARASARLPH